MMISLRSVGRRPFIDRPLVGLALRPPSNPWEHGSQAPYMSPSNITPGNSLLNRRKKGDAWPTFKGNREP